jgi:hypothetical protein
MWRGIATRSDKLLRSYRATVRLAATLTGISSHLINIARAVERGPAVPIDHVPAEVRSGI